MPDSEESRTVRWGDREFALDPGLVAPGARLEPTCPEPAASGDELVRAALRSPTECSPLRELARGKRSAAILVPGKDRVAAAQTYVPAVLDELNAGGLPDEAIDIFIATGTHARHSDEDIVGILGAETAGRARWHRHECSNPDMLQSVGVTSRGNEVLLHKAVVGADLKILTGRIIPHYFAGFGGGRKALIPGVAAFETICRNHRLTLAAEEGIHENVATCRLDGNPVHLDMLEGARFLDGTFVLNTLLDVRHRMFAAVAGELAEAHEAGCRLAAKAFRVEAPRAYRSVITSAGGAPYDCNFMQALKALFDVQDVLADGGAVLCLAQCPQGMKDGFLEWAKVRSDAELERAVRSDYNLTGHNSIMLRRLLRRARVALWSGLPEDAVRSLGIVPIDSLAEGLDWLRRETGPDAQTAVVPFANVTYATVEGEAP